MLGRIVRKKVAVKLSHEARSAFEDALLKLEPLWAAGYDAGVERAVEAEECTLNDCLLEVVAARADEAHVIYRDERWTFRQTNDMAARLANALLDSGCAKGDRVAIMLGDSPELVVSFMACYKAGLVAIGVNPRITRPELQHVLSECEPSVVILTASSIPLMRDAATAAEHSPSRLFVVGQQAEHEPWADCTPPSLCDFSLALASASAEEPHQAIGPDDTAVLIFTGGTTGVCKACPLTHRGLVFIQRRIFSVLQPLLRDARHMTSLLTSPMTHAFGLDFGVNWGLVFGGSVVIADSLEPSKLALTVEHHRPEVWATVPALMNAVLNDSDVSGDALSALEVVVVSCASSSQCVLDDFSARTGARIIQDYGMTETSGPVSLTPVLSGASRGSVGLPVANTDILVVDLETGERPLPAGGAGEVVFRGPQVITGYWRAPEETEKTFRDEWIYSGDVGYFDEEGCLFIVDRLKDVILAGGFSVFPNEIDQVLMHHPSVRDACTVGIPNEHSGEVPKSFVVLKDGATATERELIAYCHESLIAYKCPRFVEFVGSIPQTPMGKPDKKRLRKLERERFAQSHGASEA